MKSLMKLSIGQSQMWFETEQNGKDEEESE